MAFKKLKGGPKMYRKSPTEMASPAKNYKNPQDYKVFNMGNKPTPVKKVNLKGVGDAIGRGIESTAGQEIVGHLGKTLIDKLFKKGGNKRGDSTTMGPQF